MKKYIVMIFLVLLTVNLFGQTETYYRGRLRGVDNRVLRILFSAHEDSITAHRTAFPDIDEVETISAVWYFVQDGDSLKIDLGTGLYPLDLEIGDARKWGVDSTGIMVLANGLTIDNNTDTKLEINENSDEFILTFGSNTVAASSSDVTSFDFGTIDVGTDALDVSDGNITNAGQVDIDLLDADGAALQVGDGDETLYLYSSDWTIGTTGNMAGIGTVGLNGTITSTLASGTVLTASGTPDKIISAGSYGSKLNITEGSTIELSTIAAETTEDDFLIGTGVYLRTTGEDGKGFGASFLVESTNTTGTPTLEGAQIMAFLGSVGGSEAAHLKTRGGDATAGMYALWLKTGANSNCVFDSGSRTAPLWVDNQCSGTHSGEEYGVFLSTGASRPDAAFGFETTSSGYDQLFYFDETFNSGAGTCVTTEAVPGTQDARIKVTYNGTQYYIPLYR